MSRPNHGFDRNASHTEDRYVCDCGYDDCQDADDAWMNWAEAEIERLQSECDEHAAAYRHCSEERAKLQAALERIESNIGFSKTFLQKIAREALRDE